MKNLPTVSIGLPVKNGEDYLLNALDSIENQTYKNVELIISVNLSDDNTNSIVKKFAKNKKWVKVYFQKLDLSVIQNFMFTLEKSKTEFFMWLAHDDYISENYIENCLKFLLDRKNCFVVQGKCTLYSLKSKNLRSNSLFP